MAQLSDHLLAAGGPVLQGAAFGWPADATGLRSIALAGMALACLLILAAVAVVMRNRRDATVRVRLAAGFAMAFLAASAALHASEAVGPWVPADTASGLLTILGAVLGLVASVLIWPQVPSILALPSPRALARANLALAQANASLETTVAWRTHELEIANQRFEQALSRSNITVFTQDTDLIYTWVHNPRLGLRQEDLIGRRSEDFMPAGSTDDALELKRRALSTGHAASAIVSVPTRSEGRLYLDMTVSPTLDRDGKIDGVLCTAVDVTEKRLFEVRLASISAQLATAYQRFELALENSAITVFEQDTSLRYTYIYNPPPGTTHDDFIDRTDSEIFSEAEQAQVVPPKRRVLDSGGRETVELEVELGGTLRFYDLRLEAKTDVAGKVMGVVGTALDLTERRRDEQRMRLMMRELTHRSKNLLAVIQAMARKTATLSPDIDAFVVDFSSRLRAIAAAHDLLVSQSWHGADLGDLIRASVAQTLAPSAEQVRMEGPPIMLAPDTAQNLTLAFHELATNATKYGALSADEGELAVTWSRDDGEIYIRWMEQGGPEVQVPDRRGFGRVLLERLVGATLNGSVTMDFRREGLVCDIVFPDERRAAA